jgi:hypothetical protein
VVGEGEFGTGEGVIGAEGIVAPEAGRGVSTSTALSTKYGVSPKQLLGMPLCSV